MHLGPNVAGQAVGRNVCCKIRWTRSQTMVADQKKKGLLIHCTRIGGKMSMIKINDFSEASSS